MSLDELITAIHSSGADEITVERNLVKHGNQGRIGDYNLVRLKVGTSEFEFDNANGAWESHS